MGKRTNSAVWIEKRKMWRINVQKDGIRKSFYSGTPGRTGQRECNKKADEWLDENIIKTGLRVSSVCDEYLKSIQKVTGTGNCRNNDYFIRVYIKPKIGNIKLENITERHLQEVINSAYKKGLAKKTLGSLRACIQAILKFGRINKYTTLIAENLTVPVSAPVYEKTILQPADLNILFSDSQTKYRRKIVSDPNIYAYRFYVVTGLRPGELIGLKWKDIRGDVVHLWRSINTLNEETQGKNYNSRRTFKLTPMALSILDNQKALQSNMNIETEHIFSRNDGRPIIEDRLYESWIRYRNYHNLSNSTLYELRHTFVSIVKKLPEGYLKELVGHSKDMDTYGVYSHEFADDKAIAAEMVQEALSKYIKINN
jgi:integrase